MGDYMKFDKKTLFFRVLTTVCTVLLIAFIFYNSIKPAKESSESSGRVLALLNNIFEFFGIGPVFNQNIVRTLAHFGEFGLLGVLSSLSFQSFLRHKRKNMIFSVFTVASVALIDECIQLFSDGRAFQIEDMFIDISGGVVGALLVFIVLCLVDVSRKRRFKNE